MTRTWAPARAGSDRPKVERAVERLRAHFDPDAVERLSTIDTSGEEAVAACNTLGLFGGGSRLIVVDGIEAVVVVHPASIHARSEPRPACRWNLTAPSDNFIDTAISRTDSCST